MTFKSPIGVAANRSSLLFHAVTLYLIDFGEVLEIPGDDLVGLGSKGPLEVEELLTTRNGCISIVQQWYNHNCVYKLNFSPGDLILFVSYRLNLHIWLSLNVSMQIVESHLKLAKAKNKIYHFKYLKAKKVLVPGMLDLWAQ